MEKEEIACNEQFLLFPQCFLLNQKIVSPFVNIYNILSLFAAELEEPKIGMSGKGLTLSQTSPGFYVSAVQVLWKPCGKRSNFSFSHNVFYLFGELSAIFINSFSLEKSKICCLGKGYRKKKRKSPLPCWYLLFLLIKCLTLCHA